MCINAFVKLLNIFIELLKIISELKTENDGEKKKKKIIDFVLFRIKKPNMLFLSKVMQTALS